MYYIPCSVTCFSHIQKMHRFLHATAQILSTKNVFVTTYLVSINIQLAYSFASFRLPRLISLL
jgi:hypothetical protein